MTIKVERHIILDFSNLQNDRYNISKIYGNIHLVFYYNRLSKRVYNYITVCYI